MYLKGTLSHNRKESVFLLCNLFLIHKLLLVKGYAPACSHLVENATIFRHVDCTLSSRFVFLKLAYDHSPSILGPNAEAMSLVMQECAFIQSSVVIL